MKPWLDGIVAGLGASFFLFLVVGGLIEAATNPLPSIVTFLGMFVGFSLVRSRLANR